jgi:transcriptional regulator GlxA family with amidase domain
LRKPTILVISARSLPVGQLIDRPPNFAFSTHLRSKSIFFMVQIVQQFGRTTSDAVGQPARGAYAVAAHTCKDRRIARALAAAMRDLGRRLQRAEAARVACLDPAYFSKRFRSAMGVSFRVWNTTIRIQEARRLLEHTDLRIREIALAVGYDDLTTFERNFRRFVGDSPRDYRRQSSSRPVANGWETPNAKKDTKRR